MIAIHISCSAGNDKAGAKRWIKRITGIDPTKGNGYGFLGNFERFGPLAAPEGALFVCCGSGGSWKNSTKNYFLLRVKSGATVKVKRGYQEVEASNCKLVAEDRYYSDDQTQAALDAFPELAPTVSSGLLPIYHTILLATCQAERPTA